MSSPLPQGLLFCSGTTIQKAEITVEPPLILTIDSTTTSASASLSTTVGSTLNCVTAYLTVDTQSSLTAPGLSVYSAFTPLFSYTYQVPSPNVAIEIRIICSAVTAATSNGSAYGACIALFTSNASNTLATYVNSFRPASGAGTCIESNQAQFTYNLSRSTLPSTITFYVSGASSTGSTETFLSTSSSYYAGLSPTSISFNSIN